MRVLILANNDIGLYKFRKELLKELINPGSYLDGRKEEPYQIFISLPDGEFIPKLRQIGCKVVSTPVDRRGMNPFKDLKLLSTYRKIISSVKPDIVLTYTIKPNIYGGMICRYKGIPYIPNITGLGTSIEKNNFVSRIILRMYRLGIHNADFIFFQNQANKFFFEKKGVVGKQGILIPGSGVNLNDHSFEEYPKENEHVKFLFIGRIMKDKGINEYLNCAEKIKKEYPNTEFGIVGSYDENEYKVRIDALVKQDVIQYYGQQSDVHLFIKKHHALVLPSYHEGLSNVLLESSATGRPVIASNIPGCIETFDDGITGISFEPQDSDALIDAIKVFLHMPHEDKAKMGLNARKKVEIEFDKKIVVKEYIRVIREALKNIKMGEKVMVTYKELVNHDEILSLVGLGYVGMPIAVEFAKRGVNVIGFDLNTTKIETYKSGVDPTNEVGDDVIKETTVEFTSNAEDLKRAKFHIVAVPTPVNSDHTPDLAPVKGASETLGRNLTKGSIVVFESTVYPGVTEEICVPILEKESGLKCGIDFKIGYSPERINPGDKIHRLNTITKIVSGMDEEALNTIAKVYQIVVDAGVHKAESIKVAEAAKVIENSQRDINIAFMNELSIIFNKMGIDTQSVLNAAGTKWNFLNFYPGLVGGHCIGVDPYYLTYKAEELGYHSQVILSGRRINDDMGKYVAENAVKKLIKANKAVSSAQIAILGFTFKEDCPDTRNTKIIDIVSELREYGIEALIADPVADTNEAKRLYDVEFVDINAIHDMDAIILAVAHTEFSTLTVERMDKFFAEGEKVLLDLKGILNRNEYESAAYSYWRL